MGRSLRLALVVVWLAGLAWAGPAAAQGPVDCSFPVEMTDATGATVTVPAEPDRVVVLGPSAAQTMWDIDAREKVVGMPVNEFTAYLEERDEVENVVGDDGRPIQEAVVGLEPDLVLAPNIIANDTVRNLRQADLRVYRFHEARSLADVVRKTEVTGLLVGEFASAARTSARTRGTIDAVRDAVAAEDPPLVYYDLGGGWTAGSDTFIHDVITTAGGENLAATAGIRGYQQLSSEVIAERDPEVLVIHEDAAVPDDAAIENSTAIREGDVVRVDANFINQPGPRVVIPLRELAAAFHPAAYEAADVENAPVPEPARCAGDASTTTAPAETTDGATGPGLTALQAALALVALALLAARRG